MALQTGKLLNSKKAIDVMWTPEKLNDGTVGAWSLGWVAKRNTSPKAIAGIGGSRSWFYIYSEKGLSVIVLTNMKSIGPENLASEISGFFYPVLKASNGGNLPESIIPLYQLSKPKDFANVSEVFDAILAKNPNYKIAERHLVNWAYTALLIDRRPIEAIPLIKFLLRLYPDSEDGKSGLKAAIKSSSVDN